jgi:microcin C transport system ATP-binding protein
VSLLEIDNLGVRFRGSEGVVEAVRRVDLSVGAGETVALVGESGSGKSVTALSVLQLLPAQAHYPHGSVRFGGQELLGAKDRVLRGIRGNRVGMIFQEPMSSLNPLHTVEKQVGEAVTLHQGLGKRAARQRTLELLRQVRLPEPERRLGAYPHQLSGGQRQRVMIAMALANDPELLIADEPTTALDVTIQAQILELLRDLQRQREMALLLITHDLGIVRHTAERVYVMTQGRVVEHGPSTQLFSAPQHPYTQKLLAAEAGGTPTPRDATAPTLLEARDLRVWFPVRQGVLRRTVGHVKAVDGVSVSVREGQTLGVVGESGSGKTTLGLALLKLVSSRGGLTFCGRDLQRMRRGELRSLRRAVQVVFQDPFSSLSPRLTAFQIVEEGLQVHQPGETYAARRERVAQALREVGLEPRNMDHYPHEFSGGQRQRLAIARAIVLKPRLVILDEPTSALDMTIQAQIVGLLRELQQRHGLAYVFISHDLRVVRALANDIVVMKDGLVLEAGPAQSVLDAPQHEYTRALLKAAFA